MAIYARRCTQCRHTFETFAKMGQQHTIACEKCKAATEWDVQNQRVSVPAETLVGSRVKSMEFACGKHEVRKLQRMFGKDGAGECWQPDGTVKFNTKSDAKRFIRKHMSLKAAKRERQQAAGVPVDED